MTAAPEPGPGFLAETSHAKNPATASAQTRAANNQAALGGSQYAEPIIGGSQRAARVQGVPQPVFL